MPRVKPRARKRVARKSRYWSAAVTHGSDALDLERGAFGSSDPTRIARSLKRSADRSRRRKGTPFQSAMSMLISTSIAPAAIFPRTVARSSTARKTSSGASSVGDS